MLFSKMAETKRNWLRDFLGQIYEKGANFYRNKEISS